MNNASEEKPDETTEKPDDGGANGSHQEGTVNEPNMQDTPTLFLVEDEEDTADLVTLIMDKEGYQAARAADGREAMELIKSLPPPSLVLLDMELPCVDGMKVLNYIRQTQPAWQNVPVMMLTTSNNKVDVLNSIALGAKGYILKPFKRNALVSRLRRFRDQDSEPMAS